MHRLLSIFIGLWIAFVAMFNFMGIAGAFMSNDFWIAVGLVQEWYSPFNFWTVGLNLALLSPAMLAYWWRERRATQPA